MVVCLNRLTIDEIHVEDIPVAGHLELQSKHRLIERDNPAFGLPIRNGILDFESG